MSALVALVGVIVGAVAFTRAGRGAGLGRDGAVVALTLAVVGMLLAVLHLATSHGAIGTGHGKLGALVALALGLIGLILGRLALTRSSLDG